MKTAPVISVVCAGCGVSVEKSIYDINRARKFNKQLFCSKSCAIKTRFANGRKTYVMPLEKECVRCHTPKPLTDFGPNPRMLDGRRSYCKTCDAIYHKKQQQREPAKFRAYQKKCLYGITPEMEATLLAEQGGVCGICGAPPPLVIDHDHKTGIVRGLLCQRCNLGLGQLGESISNIMRAVHYLRQATQTKKTKGTKRKSAA